MKPPRAIDSHHHFWNYSTEEYGWIDESMSKLRRDFLPADLQAEIAAAGVEAVVSVQARTALVETHWLLEFANAHDWIAGVVGWVPLREAGIGDLLDGLASERKLSGVREVLQGQPAGAVLDPALNAGIAALTPRGLAYDILVFENQLAEAVQMVDAHPNQVFVLDHVAKPRIKDAVIEPWATQIRELARRENVSCKVSGMVTEADWNHWSTETLRPYFDVVLEAFTPKRLMFGSDWPVSLLGSGYSQWKQTVETFAAELSESERNELFAGTAMRAYRLFEK